jgi:hypothetical protein
VLESARGIGSTAVTAPQETQETATILN